jgi:hypothetical protein
MDGTIPTTSSSRLGSLGKHLGAQINAAGMSLDNLVLPNRG